jgi:hypothetical protein
VGLFQFAVACVFHDYEPRFGIPMWELLLLSLFLLLGNLLDLLWTARSPGQRRLVQE